MGPKEETHQSCLSQDLDLIDLDEIDDDELSRKKLREWALRHSNGEAPSSTTTAKSSFTFHKSTAINPPKENDSQDPKPQESTSQAEEAEKYRFPDWSKHIAESPEMNKKQSPSRYRHTRRMSSTVIKPPVILRQHHRHKPGIPPVPPIPEKYRVEWEQQEIKRRAEATNVDYPAFNSGMQNAANSRYVREPQAAHINAVNMASKEAARRANEKRQKAFDGVVLEDEKGRAKGKENQRGDGDDSSCPTQNDEFSTKPQLRSDVRLPRSPGMLNLAQQKPEAFSVTPEADRSLPGLPEPMVNQSVGDGDDNNVEEQALLNRPLPEVDTIHIDAIDFASEVAQMEAEAEERERDAWV